MKFSTYNGLSQPKNGYAFFDPDIHSDTKKFVDPFIVSRSQFSLARQMTRNIYGFMDELLSLVKNNKRDEAYKICKHFNETYGTCLGYSKQQIEGRGAGDTKIKVFVDTLFNTKAVVLGSISHLEELALVCQGIDKDMISDITIALVRKQLIDFTQAECKKYNIPTQKTKDKIFYYCLQSNCWLSDHFELPHVTHQSEVRQIILIPEEIVVSKTNYQLNNFYNKIAIKYFEKIALEENLSCVKSLKNGDRKVVRKELRKNPRFSGNKENVSDFIMTNPEVLHKFRNELPTYF